MLSTILASLAVGIACQALRLASRERIVIQVQPDNMLEARATQQLAPQVRSQAPSTESPSKPLQLPPFLQTRAVQTQPVHPVRSRQTTPQSQTKSPLQSEALETNAPARLHFLQGSPLDVHLN